MLGLIHGNELLRTLLGDSIKDGTEGLLNAGAKGPLNALKPDDREKVARKAIELFVKYH